MAGPKSGNSRQRAAAGAFQRFNSSVSCVCRRTLIPRRQQLSFLKALDLRSAAQQDAVLTAQTKVSPLILFNTVFCFAFVGNKRVSRQPLCSKRLPKKRFLKCSALRTVDNSDRFCACRHCYSACFSACVCEMCFLSLLLCARNVT